MIIMIIRQIKLYINFVLIYNLYENNKKNDDIII
jgi:hypothetical protein